MIDLKDLRIATAAEQGAFVEFEHPVSGDVLRDDEGRAFGIEIVGDDSLTVRKIDRKHTDAHIERSRKGKPGADSEKLESETVERLVAASRSWYLPPINGETLEFTKENARRIFSDPEYAWIPEQLIRAMKDRKRFFSAAPTT